MLTIDNQKINCYPTRSGGCLLLKLMSERDKSNLLEIRRLVATGIFDNTILKRAENIVAKRKDDGLGYRELQTELTLRSLSLYSSRALSRRNGGLEFFLADCLPPRSNLKLITNGTSVEEFFATAVTGTLERLWEAAREKFDGADNKKIGWIVDEQWWGVTDKTSGYSAKEWQIMTRCATLQRNKGNLGTVIKTICYCFATPAPERYQDAPIWIPKPKQRKGHHRKRYLP